MSSLFDRVMRSRNTPQARLEFAREVAQKDGAILLTLERSAGLTAPVVAVSAEHGAVIFRGEEGEVRKSLAEYGIRVLLEGSGPALPANTDLDAYQLPSINSNNTVSYEDERIAQKRGVYLLTLTEPHLRYMAPRAAAVSYRTGAVIARDNLLWVQDRMKRMGVPIIAEYDGGQVESLSSSPSR